MKHTSLGTGRITEIISALKAEYAVESVTELSPAQKLDKLCEVLQLTRSQFDEMLVANSAALRPLGGQAFEVVFDHVLRLAGYEVKVIGGDSDIDRIVNGIKLQLKTPYKAGSRANSVQYKTHKTHGAKSELESMEYYRSVSDFPDFLVGLISYNPFRVIFLSKDNLPRHSNDQSRILSPFAVIWDEHRGLNAFHEIGVEVQNMDVQSLVFSSEANELLPKVSKSIGLTTNVILDTILTETNFRIWDMNIRGFAREAAIKVYLDQSGIKHENPSAVRKARADKADLALQRKDNSYRFSQIKGVTLSACSFSGRDSIVGIETQLSRGRVNNHPTQSRLYRTTDFDILLVALDPALVQRYHSELGENTELQWEYYAIPTIALATHPKFTTRLKSIQSLRYADIQAYRIDDAWLSQWKKRK